MIPDKCIIKIHNDQTLGDEVARLADAGGARMYSDQSLRGYNHTGAIRFPARTGSVAYHSSNPEYYDTAEEREDYVDYPRYDARTDMPQIRAFFGQPEPEQAQPEHRKIVAIVHGDVELVAEIQAWMTAHGLNLSVTQRHQDILTIGFEVGSRGQLYSGWIGHNDPINWWVDNEDYSPNAVYDARTQMPIIKAWLMRRSTNRDMNETTTAQTPAAETTATETKPTTPQLKFVVKINTDEEWSQVTEAAYRAGFFWHSDQRGRRYKKADIVGGRRATHLSFGAYAFGGPVAISARMIVNSEDRSMLMKPGVVDLNAATDLPAVLAAFNTIHDWWKSAPTKPMQAAQFIKPNLLELIKTQPAAESTRGFIRRDLKLKLPEAVQAGGADAILKWLEENVKHDSEWPLEGAVQPAAQRATTNTEHPIEFRYTERVRSVRYDSVLVRTTVPNSVVRDAIENDDTSIITDWIHENREITQLTTIDRNMGELEDTDREYNDEESLHDQAQGLMNRLR